MRKMDENKKTRKQMLNVEKAKISMAREEKI